MKDKLKKKIRNKIHFTEEDSKKEKYGDWIPKKSRDLKAVSFKSKTPINGTQYETSLFQCTEWDNGEGYDFTINIYNQLSKQTESRFMSLHYNEIDGIIACLNDFKFFNLDI